MPAKKVREPEPAQGPRKIPERIRTQRAGPDRSGPERTKPERTGPDRPGRVKAAFGGDAQLRVPAVRKARAQSCTRDRDRGRPTSTSREVQGANPRRTRSSSTAPNPPGRRTGTEPVQRDQRRVRTEDRLGGTEPVQRRSVRTEQSHKAFTVIPPNPKKRREIQRQAEAELAALEELRLSRATAFVSINPSSVGGCMSLEEVRLKQQQEMLQAKRKLLKPMRKLLLEDVSVVTR